MNRLPIPRLGHGLPKLWRAQAPLQRSYSTAADDVDNARSYCINALRHGDYDAYLLNRFVPRRASDAYTALRALNLELVRLPESVSNPTIGLLRTQFWRDSIEATFAGRPPREPICLLLHHALQALEKRAAGSARSAQSSVRFWTQRLLRTRERHMGSAPFPSLAALEEYAENTYASVLYAVLAALPLRSVHADHLASHIGKACGIVAVLRGIPVLAAPSPSVKGPTGAEVGARREPALLLPLDVMAEVGLKEEDVFRQGTGAPGFHDAVFKVATRANDHLITAREMLGDIMAGRGPGHDFEHEGEEEHIYPSAEGDVAADVKKSFGCFLEAVPAQEYLSNLEAKDFDPFQVRYSWKLPWRIWRALKMQQI